ncbi:MAG: hypothetical protein GPJ54_00470 [Candidatus Heimdallarchaeota archaeon]|nr:hypothetical protein [Candidatus Heimdallarchaeota archaeon]
MSVQTCKRCNYGLQDDWVSCPNCSTMINDKTYWVSCNRCFQIIYDSKPNFCPFCRYQQVKKVSVKGEEVIEIDVVTPFEEPERVSIEIHDDKITKTEVINALKFDTDAQLRIAGSTFISKYNRLIILLIGISGATSFLLATAIFPGGSFTDGAKLFVITAVVYPCVLYVVAFTLRELMKMVGLTPSPNAFKNVIASTVPVFIVKDILAVLISTYVLIFMGSTNNEVAVGIYTTLTGIAMLILVVQLLLFVKNVIGTSGLLSFILILISLHVAGIIGGYYIGRIVLLLLDLII